MTKQEEMSFEVISVDPNYHSTVIEDLKLIEAIQFNKIVRELTIPSSQMKEISNDSTMAKEDYKRFQQYFNRLFKNGNRSSFNNV